MDGQSGNVTKEIQKCQPARGGNPKSLNRMLGAG